MKKRKVEYTVCMTSLLGADSIDIPTRKDEINAPTFQWCMGPAEVFNQGQYAKVAYVNP